MKNTTKLHALLSLLLVIVLSAAMVFSLVACDGNESKDDSKENESSAESGAESVSEPEKTVLGTGNVQFTAEVKHLDGTVKRFTVKTDKKTVADALVEVGLIAGEDGPFGLYITTVNGEFHKWESDGKYWAFYVNGESSFVGASGVDVRAGDTYAFRAE